MKTKRFVVIFSLGLALMLTLMWMLNSTFDPAQAYTDTTVTPAPTIDRVGVSRSRQLTDDQNQTQSGVTPLKVSVAGIANGGFENGQDGSWEEYSAHGWDIIVDTSILLPTPPHSGSWAAWLGGDFDDVSYISQSVTIPAEAPTLSFWNWIASEGTCGCDFGWVKINDTTVQTIDLCGDNNTSGWVNRTVDLSAYAGQTVTLQIRVETDGSLNSNYYIDDVMVGEMFYTYLPLTLRNFWAGYFDDFSDPNSGWDTGENARQIYRYLGGEYQIYVKTEWDGFAITPDLVLPSDYRIEVDARKVSAGACSYGLIFGAHWTSDSYEAYQVIVYPTTGEFFVNKRALDGSWSTIKDWTYSSAINQNDGTNHITVDRIGTTIKLYMNGTQVANITDSSFVGPGRDAGIRAYSYGDVPVDVRFDNFSASQP